jgi:translation initiation factor 2 beta subunit (eIF-2beta)/eIF-5
LQFTFNENIIDGSGNIIIYDTFNNVIQTIDVSSVNVSIVDNEVTVNISDLGYNTLYYVNIDSGAFEDGSGNSFTGLDSSSNSGMRFTTEIELDTSPPSIINFNPLLNATNVSVNTPLEFTFDENIINGTGNITIYDNSDNIVESIDVSNVNVSIVDDQVTINPSFDLSYSTSYYVSIDSVAFEDCSCNSFTGLDSSSNNGMRFTTSEEPDIIAPTLSSFIPLLNATDVSINTPLEFTFDENIVNGTGNITIYDNSDNIIESINVSSTSLSISGEILTINLSSDLSYNNSYYVNIDSGAIQDEAGNNYIGLDSSGADTGMRFTTEEDITSPIIIQFNPISGRINFPINGTLAFTFNEDIVIGSGNITVHRVSDNTLIKTFDISSSEVSIVNNKIIINPSTDFPYNTALYVNIDSGIVDDVHNNNFIGLDSSSLSTGLRFTTERDLVPPSLVSFSPGTGITDVSVNTTIDFTFSEDVYVSNGNITINRSSNDIILQVINVTSPNVIISGRDVIVNLIRDLPYDLSVYVNIDSGSFRDNANNRFVGLNSKTVSGIQFTTIVSGTPRNDTPPTLISNLPTLNETKVRLDTPLTFTFSKEVVPASGNIFIYNAINNQLIQSIDVNNTNVKISGEQVTVTLLSDLPENTQIYVNISSNAFVDIDGNNYAGLPSSIFGTGIRFNTVNLGQTRLFDIIKFCQDKKCQQNIQYNRLKTGGNDPSMSSAMRYAQYVRAAKPKTNQ